MRSRGGRSGGPESNAAQRVEDAADISGVPPHAGRLLPVDLVLPLRRECGWLVARAVTLRVPRGRISRAKGERPAACGADRSLPGVRSAARLWLRLQRRNAVASPMPLRYAGYERQCPFRHFPPAFCGPGSTMLRRCSGSFQNGSRTTTKCTRIADCACAHRESFAGSTQPAQPVRFDRGNST